MSSVNKKPDFLFLKAIIYRIFRIFIVFIAGFITTGEPFIALNIALVDMVAATAFYYYFDKFWNKISIFIENLYIKIKYKKLNL